MKNYIALFLLLLPITASSSSFLTKEDRELFQPHIPKEVFSDVELAIKSTRKHTLDLRKKIPNFESRLFKVMGAIAWMESRFRPFEVSDYGAMGIFQLKPDTARLCSEKFRLGYFSIINELFNIRSSSIIAAHCLVDYLIQTLSFEEAVKMYYQGPAYKEILSGEKPHITERRQKRAKEYYKDVMEWLNKIEPSERKYESGR